MRNKLFVMGLVLMLVFSAGSANALTWATGMADIYGAGGLDVTIPGSEYDMLTSIADPFGGTITFDDAVTHFIVGSSWSTWSHGYTGPILAETEDNSVRMTFDYAVFGFGMYVEPNSMSPWDITVGLSDGSAVTKTVDGMGGADFFGFIDGSISWVQIDAVPEALGFGFGEMVMAKDGAVVPEPTTLVLLGLGMGAMGLVRRFRH